MIFMKIIVYLNFFMIFLQIIACLGALILPLMPNLVKKVDKNDK